MVSNQADMLSRAMLIPMSIAEMIKPTVEKMMLVDAWLRRLLLFGDDMMILSLMNG